MSALQKGQADKSVAAAQAFTRECLGYQYYNTLSAEFTSGPGQPRAIYQAFSGLQVILATGAGSILFGKGEQP